MGRSDDEWVVVRNRRGTRPEKQQKLRAAIPIPVVPLKFDALREDDPAEVARKQKEKEKRKAKAQRKKERKAAGDDDGSDEAPEEAAGATGAPAAKAKAQSAVAPSRALAVSQQTGFLSALRYILTLQFLVAFFAWLGGVLGLASGTGQRKQKKAKPRKVPAAPEASAAAPAKAAEEPAKKAPESQSQAKGGQGKAAPPAQQQQQQKAQQAVPPASPATGKAPQPASEKPAAASAPAPAPGASAAADAGKAPAPAAKREDRTTAPAPAPTAPTPAAPAPPAAKKAPEPPPAPVVSCDKDWRRGRFTVAGIPAHSDVLSSVAMGSNGTVITSAVDGAVKLWKWSSGGVPHHVRNLVGHTGRVEAVAAHPSELVAVSAGRDASLKVWNTASDGNPSATSSVYTYESVKSMSVDWAGERAMLAMGCNSGSVMVYELQPTRKLQVLRGHTDEVSAVCIEGNRVVSGSRDGTVRLWDVREARQVALLRGVIGRVSSIDVWGDHTIFVGDYSSCVKVYDVRKLPGSKTPLRPACVVPNAPAFAGDACPIAGLKLIGGGSPGVLVSTGIAWWTPNRQALEEAPEGSNTPEGVLNIHAIAPSLCATAGAPQSLEYLHSVRLGTGVPTCLAQQGDRVLVGTSEGTLAALVLGRGAGSAMAARGAVAQAAARDLGRDEEGVVAVLEEGLKVGVEVLSDEEDEEYDGEDESSGDDE